MRRVLSQIFTLPKSILSRYFSDDFNLDPRNRPIDLLTELDNKKNIKKLLQTINKKERNGLKLLKKFTVAHLCLVYNSSFCEPFLKIDFQTLSQSQWLNQNILKPYARFLNKICCSYQAYRQITTDHIVNFTFDNLFFAIKLLKDLLECSKKLSSLFHYYKQQVTERFPFLLDNYACLLAFHAEKIYAIFKVILTEFIRFPHRYILDKETEKIMKYILQFELQKLNEEMMGLFLNSSFFPFGKGYGVKLLKIENLPDQTRDYAESIIYAQQIRPKRSKKVTLDSILFDKNGKLNPQIYQGLQQITLGEDGQQRYQSILQSRIGNHVSIKSRNYQENIENI